MPVTTQRRTATPATKTSAPGFLPRALQTRLEKEKEEQAARASAAGNFLRAPSDGNTVEFRVMSECRWGYEVWYTYQNDEGKDQKSCMRWDAEALNDEGLDEPPAVEIPEGADTMKNGEPKVSTFMAMVVYNLGEDRFQIWSFTQSTIKEQFTLACENKRFGDPRGYDFAWTRKGKTITDTVHTLQALPPSELPEEIVTRYEEFQVDLAAFCQGASSEEIFPKAGSANS